MRVQIKTDELELIRAHLRPAAGACSLNFIDELALDGSTLRALVKNFQIYCGLHVAADRPGHALKKKRLDDQVNHIHAHRTAIAAQVNSAATNLAKQVQRTLADFFFRHAGQRSKFDALVDALVPVLDAAWTMPATAPAHSAYDQIRARALRQRAAFGIENLRQLRLQADALTEVVIHGRLPDASSMRSVLVTQGKITGTLSELHRTAPEGVGDRLAELTLKAQATLHDLTDTAHQLDRLVLLNEYAMQLMAPDASKAACRGLLHLLDSSADPDLQAIGATIAAGTLELAGGAPAFAPPGPDLAADVLTDDATISSFATFITRAENAARQVADAFDIRQVLRCLFDIYWCRSNHSPDKRARALMSDVLLGALEERDARSGASLADDPLRASGAVARLAVVLLLKMQIGWQPSALAECENTQLMTLLDLLWRKADRERIGDLIIALEDAATSDAWRTECTAFRVELDRFVRGGHDPYTENAQAHDFHASIQRGRGRAPAAASTLDLPRLGALHGAARALDKLLKPTFQPHVLLALVSKYDWLLRSISHDSPQWEAAWTSRAIFIAGIAANMERLGHTLAPEGPLTPAKLACAMTHMHADLPPWQGMGRKLAPGAATIYDTGICTGYAPAPQPWTLQAGDALRRALARDAARYGARLRGAAAPDFERAHELLLNLLVLPRNSKTRLVTGSLGDQHLGSALAYLLSTQRSLALSIGQPVREAHLRAGTVVRPHGARS